MSRFTADGSAAPVVETNLTHGTVDVTVDASLTPTESRLLALDLMDGANAIAAVDWSRVDDDPSEVPA